MVTSQGTAQKEKARAKGTKVEKVLVGKAEEVLEIYKAQESKEAEKADSVEKDS